MSSNLRLKNFGSGSNSCPLFCIESFDVRDFQERRCLAY
jgi:hypothetical protein